MIVGSAFAALDYRVNLRKDLDGRDGIQSLRRNLFISGAIVWLTLPGHAIAMNFVLLWPIHRRYHAYPPEMQFFEKLALLPPFLIALALLWAMIKTLRRYKPRNFSENLKSAS